MSIEIQPLSIKDCDHVAAIELAASDTPWTLAQIVHLMQHGIKRNQWAKIAVGGDALIGWVVWRLVGSSLICSRLVSCRDPEEVDAVTSLLEDGMECGAKLGAKVVSVSVRDVDACFIGIFEHLCFARVADVKTSNGNNKAIYQRRLDGTLQETVQ